jgi:hypothetical protein
MNTSWIPAPRFRWDKLRRNDRKPFSREFSGSFQKAKLIQEAKADFQTDFSSVAAGSSFFLPFSFP